MWTQNSWVTKYEPLKLQHRATIDIHSDPVLNVIKATQTM